MKPEAELAALDTARQAASPYQGIVCVNDSPELAGRFQADMLHLGQADGSSARASQVSASWALLGRSTHAPRQVDKAIKDRNVDYFCVGPVYATSTKPDYEPVGLTWSAMPPGASRRDQVEALVRHWRYLAGQHRRCDRGRGAAGPSCEPSPKHPIRRKRLAA